MGANQLLDDYIKFVMGAKIKDLPEEVISKAKISIADTLGVTVRGSVEPIFMRVSKSIEDLYSSEPESTDFTAASKTGMLRAAFVNSLAGHVLLFDDEHNESVLHPGCVILPSLLAFGETLNSSGIDFLLSYVLAYESSIRFALGLSPSHYELGFSPTGTVNSIGGLIGLCKMANFSEEMIKTAIGICAQQMGGTRIYQSGGHTNYAMFLSAEATQNSLISLRLAYSGIEPIEATNDENSLFYPTFSRSEFKDCLSFSGKKWHIKDIKIKLYPSSRFCHGPVSRILKLIKERGLDYNDIKNVEIGLDKVRYDISNVDKVFTRGEAIFSLQYNMAAAIISNKLSLDEFSEDSIKNAKIRSVMAKIKPLHSEDCDLEYPQVWTTHLKVVIKNGEVLEDSFDSLSIENPTLEQVKKKFFDNMAVKFSGEDTERIWNTIMNLENVGSIAELTSMFRKED